MIEISIYLRVFLVLGSISTAAFILKRIRQAKVQIEDCIFWLFFAAFLLLLSIFPEVASWVSRLLEFESPINLVYLLIIFVLLVHQFSMTVRISHGFQAAHPGAESGPERAGSGRARGRAHRSARLCGPRQSRFLLRREEVTPAV